METKHGTHDPKTLVTEARLKEELNMLSEAIEKALNSFQRDLIGGQSRSNLVWNTVNVVLAVLVANGLVTEADIEKHGETLWKATVENMKRTKKAIKMKRPLRKEELIPTSLDSMTETMGRIHTRMAEQEKLIAAAEDMAEDEERQAL